MGASRWFAMIGLAVRLSRSGSLCVVPARSTLRPSERLFCACGPVPFFQGCRAVVLAWGGIEWQRRRHNWKTGSCGSPPNGWRHSFALNILGR